MNTNSIILSVIICLSVIGLIGYANAETCSICDDSNMRIDPYTHVKIVSSGDKLIFPTVDFNTTMKYDITSPMSEIHITKIHFKIYTNDTTKFNIGKSEFVFPDNSNVKFSEMSMGEYVFPNFTEFVFDQQHLGKSIDISTKPFQISVNLFSNLENREKLPVQLVIEFTYVGKTGDFKINTGAYSAINSIDAENVIYMTSSDQEKSPLMTLSNYDLNDVYNKLDVIEHQNEILIEEQNRTNFLLSYKLCLDDEPNSFADFNTTGTSFHNIDNCAKNLWKGKMSEQYSLPWALSK